MVRDNPANLRRPDGLSSSRVKIVTARPVIMKKSSSSGSRDPDATSGSGSSSLHSCKLDNRISKTSHYKRETDTVRGRILSGLDGKKSVFGRLGDRGTTESHSSDWNRSMTSNRLSDQKVSSSRWSETNIAKSCSSERNVTSSCSSEQNLAKSRSSDWNVTSSHSSDRNMTSSRLSDQKVTSSRTSQENMAKRSSNDCNVTSTRSSDRDMTSSRLSDRKVNSSRSSEQKVTSSRSSEHNMAKRSSSDWNVTSSRSSDRDMTSGRLRDQKVTSTCSSEQNMAKRSSSDRNVTSSCLGHLNMTKSQSNDRNVASNRSSSLSNEKPEKWILDTTPDKRIDKVEGKRFSSPSIRSKGASPLPSLSSSDCRKSDWDSGSWNWKRKDGSKEKVLKQLEERREGGSNKEQNARPVHKSENNEKGLMSLNEEKGGGSKSERQNVAAVTKNGGIEKSLDRSAEERKRACNSEGHNMEPITRNHRKEESLKTEERRRAHHSEEHNMGPFSESQRKEEGLKQSAKKRTGPRNSEGHSMGPVSRNPRKKESLKQSIEERRGYGSSEGRNLGPISKSQGKERSSKQVNGGRKEVRSSDEQNTGPVIDDGYEEKILKRLIEEGRQAGSISNRHEKKSLKQLIEEKRVVGSSKGQNLGPVGNNGHEDKSMKQSIEEKRVVGSSKGQNLGPVGNNGHEEKSLKRSVEEKKEVGSSNQQTMGPVSNDGHKEKSLKRLVEEKKEVGSSKRQNMGPVSNNGHKEKSLEQSVGMKQEVCSSKRQNLVPVSNNGQEVKSLKQSVDERREVGSSEGRNTGPHKSYKMLMTARQYKTLLMRQDKTMEVAIQDQGEDVNFLAKSPLEDANHGIDDGCKLIDQGVECSIKNHEQLIELSDVKNPLLEYMSDLSQKKRKRSYHFIDPGQKLDADGPEVVKKHENVVGNAVHTKPEEDDSEGTSSVDNRNQLLDRASSPGFDPPNQASVSRVVVDNNSIAQRYSTSRHVDGTKWIDTRNSIQEVHVKGTKRIDAEKSNYLLPQQEVSKLCKTPQLSSPKKSTITYCEEQVPGGEYQQDVAETNRCCDCLGENFDSVNLPSFEAKTLEKTTSNVPSSDVQECVILSPCEENVTSEIPYSSKEVPDGALSVEVHETADSSDVPDQPSFCSPDESILNAPDRQCLSGLPTTNISSDGEEKYISDSPIFAVDSSSAKDNASVNPSSGEVPVSAILSIAKREVPSELPGTTSIVVDNGNTIAKNDRTHNVASSTSNASEFCQEEIVDGTINPDSCLHSSSCANSPLVQPLAQEISHSVNEADKDECSTYIPDAPDSEIQTHPHQTESPLSCPSNQEAPITSIAVATVHPPTTFSSVDALISDQSYRKESIVDSVIQSSTSNQEVQLSTTLVATEHPPITFSSVDAPISDQPNQKEPILEPVEKLQSSTTTSFHIDVAPSEQSAHNLSVIEPIFPFSSFGVEHQIMGDNCILQDGQVPMQQSEYLQSHPIQTTIQDISRNPAPFFPDPLQIELEKITKEKDQELKLYEQTKLQLKSDCTKELRELLAQICQKYQSKGQLINEQFVAKMKELNVKYSKVWMHKTLAENARSEWSVLSTSSTPAEHRDMATHIRQQQALQRMTRQPFPVQHSTSASPVASTLQSGTAFCLPQGMPHATNFITSVPNLQDVQHLTNFSGGNSSINPVSAPTNLPVNREIPGPASHPQLIGQPSASLRMHSRGWQSQLAHDNPSPTSPSFAPIPSLLQMWTCQSVPSSTLQQCEIAGGTYSCPNSSLTSLPMLVPTDSQPIVYPASANNAPSIRTDFNFHSTVRCNAGIQNYLQRTSNYGADEPDFVCLTDDD